MVSVERSSLSVLIQSPYRMREGVPSGVNSYIEEMIPFLKKEGCDVKTVRPVSPLGEKDRSDYHLGWGVSIPANGTNFDIAISFNKLGARNILEDAMPHVVVIHEPGVPNISHTLASSIPKLENGKRLVPVIGHFHAGRPPNGLDLKTKLLEKALQVVRRPKIGGGIGVTSGYTRTLEKAMTGRIAVSLDTATFWNEHSAGEYRVIPNGIRLDTFTSQGPRFEDWDDGKKTILSACRHDVRKGLEYLLEAYGSLRRAGVDNLKLKLVGKGDVTEKLKEKVRREEIPDVEFLGVLSTEDLARAYRSADVLAAPSIGGEGFNRTIAESRSSGTLVVCTDIDGQRSAIGDDLFPFMAKPCDSDDLAQKINEILNLSEEAARELRVDSRRDAVERFAWPVIARENVRYWEQVLAKHGEVPQWKKSRRSFVNKIPVAGNIYVSDS